MELNKNKMIFLAIGAMIFLSLVFLLVTVNKNAANEETNKDPSNTFKIWGCMR